MLLDLEETQRKILSAQRTSGKRIDQLLSDIFHFEAEKSGDLRSMLAETHGLNADSADFMIQLSQQIDLAAFERDKCALKESFSYRSYAMICGNLFCRTSTGPSTRPAAH